MDSKNSYTEQPNNNNNNSTSNHTEKSAPLDKGNCAKQNYVALRCLVRQQEEGKNFREARDNCVKQVGRVDFVVVVVVVVIVVIVLSSCRLVVFFSCCLVVLLSCLVV